MWTRGFRILWVKVDVRNEKHFYLNLPISLYAFEELLDWVMDLLELACFFSPKKPVNSSSVSVHTVKELARGIIRLLDSLTDSEP
jgi:hypothetical protein